MTDETAGNDFEAKVRLLLAEHGFSVLREPSVGGLRPDFMIRGDQGTTVVIEVRKWSPNPANLARALHQVDLYRSATGTQAFLVLPNAPNDLAHLGVFSLSTLKEELHKLAAATQGSSKPPEKWRLGHENIGPTGPCFPLEQPTTQIAENDRVVFAAMPFEAKYDDVYFVAIASAAKGNEATCTRVDQEDFNGDIVEKIRLLIDQSSAVVADLSDGNPNVMYEVGYAHGLGKPTIHLCSTPLAELPFDVSHWNTISYEIGRTHELAPKLLKHLKAILHRGPSPGK